jgi:hypothetical protein
MERYGASMDLTPQETLGKWLLQVLGGHGGSARKADALRLMERQYGHLLTEDDWLPQPSNTEPKWQNQTAWERNRLVRSGMLHPTSTAGWGVWSLTDLGWAVFRSGKH